MRTNADASGVLLQYVKRFEKQSGHTVTTIHTDSGTEFSRATKTLTDKEAAFTTSTVVNPQSNGLAVRTHLTILNDFRACGVCFDGVPKRGGCILGTLGMANNFSFLLLRVAFIRSVNGFV